ncbi:MAG: AAA family ATPase [Alistipes sp.]|nr:AAA family ATPase [Candidatus Alistipes equi]
MNRLFTNYNRLLSIYAQYSQTRYLHDQINWNNRLILIRGPKGSGKTTMLFQHILCTFPDHTKALYCSLDHLWFASHSLLELAEYAYTHAITHLFLDEIHRYNTWAVELKNIYDAYPELHIVATGSNTLDIIHQVADLSRRCEVYTMYGLSFREYLKMEGVADLPIIPLQDIFKRHIELATEITSTKKIKILPYFEQYCKEGYYPFYRESDSNYLDKLSQVIDTIIFTEIPAIAKLEYDSIYKVKPLLAILAQQNPYTINISSLCQSLNISRNALLKLIDLLDKAALIRRLYAETDAWKQLNKPEKILFNNTNLMFALSPNADLGTMRETFVTSMLAQRHLLAMPQKGDLLVDQKYLLEVGGRSKGYKQIAGIKDSFVVQDNIELGFENKIPMWMFGFLY